MLINCVCFVVCLPWYPVLPNQMGGLSPRHKEDIIIASEWALSQLKVYSLLTETFTRFNITSAKIKKSTSHIHIHYKFHNVFTFTVSMPLMSLIIFHIKNEKHKEAKSTMQFLSAVLIYSMYNHLNQDIFQEVFGCFPNTAWSSCINMTQFSTILSSRH